MDTQNNKKKYIVVFFVVIIAITGVFWWYQNNIANVHTSEIMETTVLSNSLCASSTMTDNDILSDHLVSLKNDFAMSNAALGEFAGEILAKEDGDAMRAYLVERFGEQGAQWAEDVLCGTVSSGVATADIPETLTQENITKVSEYISSFLAERGTQLDGIRDYVSALCGKNTSMEDAYTAFVATFSELELSNEEMSTVLTSIFEGKQLPEILTEIEHTGDTMQVRSGMCR